MDDRERQELKDLRDHLGDGDPAPLDQGARERMGEMIGKAARQGQSDYVSLREPRGK
jgi:predicted nucleic acid-binding protein